VAGRIFIHLEGFHSRELQTLVHTAWDEGDLLVLCPSRVKDDRFLDILPPGSIEVIGDRKSRGFRSPPLDRTQTYPARPVLGVFTTGTVEGEPKLVLYSRRNIEASIVSILSLFDTPRIDAIFAYPQPSHTFGLTLGYVMAHVLGVPLHFGEGRYGRSFHEVRAGLTSPGLMTLGTPTHFLDLRAYVQERGLSLAPSYSAIVGGAPVSLDLWHQLRDDLAIEKPSVGYGATEASPGVTHLAPGCEPKADGDIGSALPGVGLQLTEAGVVFTGENVAMAMFHGGRLEFPKRGLLTDDLLAIGEGRFIYRGRKAANLNRGGEKFSLARLEAGLGDYVRAPVMALALPDDRLGEELGVLYEGTAPIDPEALTAYLEKTFGCRFAQRRVQGVKSLPKNESGKPDVAEAKRCLLEISAASLTALVPHRPPLVWIHSVLSIQETGGICRFIFDANAAYADFRGIRRSSYVELLAQAYAFIQAAAEPQHAKPTRVLLAGFSQVEFPEGTSGPRENGDELRIEVKRVRQMGPLSLVQGTVKDLSGRTIARGQLKLFAEYETQ
jgi:hypothetical protein